MFECTPASGEIIIIIKAHTQKNESNWVHYILINCFEWNKRNKEKSLNQIEKTHVQWKQVNLKLNRCVYLKYTK